MNIMPRCPKCGSRAISNVKMGGLPKCSGSSLGGMRTNGEKFPNPNNDYPGDKYLPLMHDFNFRYYCNTCKYFFGKSGSIIGGLDE